MTDERMSGGGDRPVSPQMDRYIPDPESGGPPTARNVGWYTNYLPEQRYIAYLGVYSAFADMAANDRTNEFADYAAWILGHAAYDKEANEAGVAMLQSEPEGEGRTALAEWHNSIYGEGIFYDNMDHPYADLKLPKINIDDPEGTIERFITADINGYREEGSMGSREYSNTLTERAMLWTIGLWDKNAREELDQPRPGAPETNLQDVFERVGEVAHGPEESGFGRNVQHFAAQAFTDVALGATVGGLSYGSSAGASVLRSPAAASIGLTRAWAGYAMGTAGRSVATPIAQGMKAVTSEGIRLSAARMANGIASLSTKARNTSGPVGWFSRQSPRVKVGAVGLSTGAATTGYGAARAATMPVGDIDIGDVVENMPEGAQRDYVQDMMQRQYDERQEG